MIFVVMAKPTILAVDDDPQVLSVLDTDLKARYQGDYRILRASSGEEALGLLDRLKERSDPLALVIADQRMPGLSGVETLTQVRERVPDAKRVLLTAYADMDAAVRAINDAHLDYYLTKPWDPPSDNLYPVLDDQLQTWTHCRIPEFEGVKVIGHRWSAASHEIKDLLARNQVPYRWLDIERDDEAKRIASGLAPRIPCFPIVKLSDGTLLEEPSESELAEKVGLRTRAGQPFYDLVIVGGGPTGLAAALYGASEGLSTLMIEQHAPGGQAGTTSRIENYLGFPTGVSGAELAKRAVMQVKRFNVEIVAPQSAHELQIDSDYRKLVLGDGSIVACHALLLAMGVSYRKLEVPGAEQFEGRGIYYGAALTEAISCADEDVFVVGGANSAGQGAMYLSQYAKSVGLLIRADSMEKGMSQYLVDQIKQVKNIKVYTDTVVTSIQGKECLEGAEIKNLVSGETAKCPASSVFVFIGAEPKTDWLGDTIARDDHGFILTGPDLKKGSDGPLKDWHLQRDPFLLETNVPGVFAAGDIRHGAVRRVAAGVGTGSTAVQLIHQYLADLK
jgi:thioredoxin reductase (NADPH)